MNETSSYTYPVIALRRLDGLDCTTAEATALARFLNGLAPADCQKYPIDSDGAKLIETATTKLQQALSNAGYSA